MSRMNQVMQIGNIEGDIHYYIEDYAYTYLKKQKGKEKTKYFLYGEKEESNKQKKLYIYGISEKPKMEQTYFKEYYPLGFLKMNQDETFWINLKGQEQKISGFYVFYAPNQAMQEYLVDNQKEEKTDKPEDKAKRQLDREVLPMKETLVPARKIKKQKNSDPIKNEKFIVPIGGIVIAGLILLVLTSSNGQKKLEIFRQVIAETMSGMIKETSEEDFIIEEKNIGQKEPEDENGLNQEEQNNANYAKWQNTEKQDDILQESVSETQNEILQGNGSETQNEILQENGSKEQNGIKQNMETIQENLHNIDMSKTEQEKQAGEILEETAEGNTGEKIKDIEQKEGTQEAITSDSKKDYEEYVVKNGDTLVAICKTKYGSLVKMNEICSINNIKNADYIAPGQKLYLP